MKSSSGLKPVVSNPKLKVEFTWKQLALIGKVMLIYSWRADIPMPLTNMAERVCKTIRQVQVDFKKQHKEVVQGNSSTV
jgi:hypothetical protein